jgi:heme/copper-type cytochrome/quinol oxidase subunit 1
VNRRPRRGDPRLFHCVSDAAGAVALTFCLGLGLAGMPRRIPDFPTAWVGWNGVICAGVILSVMGGVLFFVLFDSQRHRNGRGLPHLGPAPCAAGVLA